MSVPKYDEMYTDVLCALVDKKECHIKDIRDAIATARQLSDEDLAETLSSGDFLFRNRVAWSCEFLLKAGLIHRMQRGVYSITDEGKKILETYAGKIDNALLKRYPSFQEWDAASKSSSTSKEPLSPSESSDATPEEVIDSAFQELENTLSDRIMEEIMDRDAAFFERLVVKLLLKMGYSRTNDGHVTPLSGDGGIDGIISEDRLGLSRLYFQAKRWELDKSVGRPEIQKFSGALHDVNGTKGLFITTARFTKEAQESAQRQNIVLVNGRQLTQLMIEYGLGVSTAATYEIKRLDSDFFNEDE